MSEIGLDPYDDPGTPWEAHPQETFGSPDDFQVMTLAWATVGWEGQADVADKGDGSDTENGPTLVRVTMHVGATPGEPQSPSGAAAGYQRTALPPTFPQYVPKAGQRCVLAFPDGPTGQAVIVAYYGPAAASLYGKKTAKLDFGDQNLVISAASVTIKDSAGNIVTVSPDMGIQLADESGSGAQVYQGTVMIRSQDGDGNLKSFASWDTSVAQIVHVSGGGMKAKGADAVLCGANVQIPYLGSLMLGNAASPATRVMVGPGPGTAAVGSQSIFGSA